MVGAGVKPERLAQVWLFIVAPLIGAGIAGYLYKSGILAADDVIPTAAARGPTLRPRHASGSSGLQFSEFDRGQLRGAQP